VLARRKEANKLFGCTVMRGVGMCEMRIIAHDVACSNRQSVAQERVE
jgi:hypothetical protein